MGNLNKSYSASCSLKHILGGPGAAARSLSGAWSSRHSKTAAIALNVPSPEAGSPPRNRGFL